MKRRFCALLAALMLFAPALAESSSPSASSAAPTLAPTASAQASATPSPEPTPVGVPYEGEELNLTLPERLHPLEGAALEGYEAAVQADYPDAARTLLAAASEDMSAAASFALLESEADCVQAAREAAEGILGSADSVAEFSYGENRCAAFACAIGEQTYSLYFFSNGTSVLVAGMSGLEEAEISMMLSSLRF